MANRVWSDRELKVLANRIRMVRRMLGLTQAKFAERIEVSRSTVSKVERGEMKAPYKLVHRIETAYGVELTENMNDKNWAPKADHFLREWSDIVRDEYKSLPPITRRIYEMMKRRNITQRELAKSTGLTFATINAWKQKKRTPNSDVIIPICTALNVTPYYLLVGKEEGMPYPEEYL